MSTQRLGKSPSFLVPFSIPAIQPSLKSWGEEVKEEEEIKLKKEEDGEEENEKDEEMGEEEEEEKEADLHYDDGLSDPEEKLCLLLRQVGGDHPRPVEVVGWW